MQTKTSLSSVFLALFTVYITWGSTYIGFKLSLQVVGPFLCAGGRNLIGGLLLALVLLLKGNWKSLSWHSLGWIALLAIPMVFFGCGFLGLGQTQVPSSIAAILCSSTPILMVLAGYLFAGEPRPSPLQCCGLLLGGAAIIFLGYTHGVDIPTEHPYLGGLAVLSAVLGWVFGSLIFKKKPLQENVHSLQTTAWLLIFGGIENFLFGFLLGEQYELHWENLNTSVVIAFSWMSVGGSLLAYAGYIWLLTHVPLCITVSYEYVLPIIGLFLGWFIGGESISLSTLIACGTMISSVALILIPMTSKTPALHNKQGKH